MKKKRRLNALSKTEFPTYWFHTESLAKIKASRLSQFYKKVRIKKEKTKAFGWVYNVYHGELK